AAELFVKCLENEGVEFVFGLPGEEVQDLMLALKKSKIKFICTRHEQGAAFMADVYGRLTGKAGVCLSTLGPGATNLLTGIADANLDHSPVVAITGQGSMKSLHKVSHQVIDIVQMFKPVTKWNTRVSVPGTIPEIVRKAFKVSEMEKPGATHIELSEDIAGEEVQGKEPLKSYKLRRPGAEYKALSQAVELLKNSQKPIILAGNGAIRKIASKQLREFVQKTGIPVVSTYMAKGAVSDESENSLFTIGLGANKKIFQIFKEADLVLAVGYDIAEYDPVKWNPSADKKIIHIDFAPAEVYEHYIPEVEIVSDISDALWNLNQQISKKFSFPEAKILRKEILEEQKKASEFGEKIFTRNVLHCLRKAMSPKDVLISDVGIHKMWIGSRFPTYEPGTIIISNGFASMGIAVPGAIGAKLARPEQRIVAVTGDGGFLMNSQELETAKRLGLAFVVVVLDDQSYALIEEKFTHNAGETFGTDLENPDFNAYGKSFGIQTETITNPKDLQSAIETALNSNKLCIIDVKISKADNKDLFK
ncbi:MAG: acetolactate synthase large subunit, partial [Candidatus Diapherotrites archaeon]|nr:acetolactate synthase large subunit [Candidatus Diapherotrites archaeon]